MDNCPGEDRTAFIVVRTSQDGERPYRTIGLDNISRIHMIRGVGVGTDVEPLLMHPPL